ncbi:hypothetical protein NDA01_03665 [Trichocoleus desertorum AS-A10]|uniref:KGK domain-containing protein n=1 Tax=Trichocoleus desertorum TaxID=1481672 RepID=UPI00329A6928
MSEFESLELDDVACTPGLVVVKHPTFQVSEYMEALSEFLRSYLGATEQSNQLLNEGVPGKVLKPGKGWQTGKLRMRLEFCPDEPEEINLSEDSSPLDEYR